MNTVSIQQITGIARSVSELLTGTRYGLDYYQREYSWGDTQVTEFVHDLAGRFLDEFEDGHQRSQVEQYRPYFLGPIVIARNDGVAFLVDGQQRMTTLTLLLMHVRHLLADADELEAQFLSSLIFAPKFGKLGFSLDVPERDACMNAIFRQQEFDASHEPESVRNIWERYRTIEETFPNDLLGPKLVHYSDWLQHRVMLVEIGAPDQDMALEVFETMNDRGLRLSNVDMLKSHLLAGVRDDEVIRNLNLLWRQRITELRDTDKSADAEFVKAWLRGHYAESQRERRANAVPGDFDIIGTAFHKWVRDNNKHLGLTSRSTFRSFVEHEFFRMSGKYMRLVEATQTMRPGLEAVYFNALNGFSLQLPTILASLTPDDDDETFVAKAAMIAGAIDIFVVRRMVNYRNFGYSTVVYTMFNVIKELRRRSVQDISGVLSGWLASDDRNLANLRTYEMTNRKGHVRYILARMTSWLSEEMGQGEQFTQYMDRGTRDPFEIEHIWASRYERHQHEFPSVHDFEKYRNRIGGLLLLRKSFNASYGDKPYAKKIKHYDGQNPLVRSLHPHAYQNNPQFLRLRDEHELSFKPYETSFAKADLDERQQLYTDIAEKIWDPARIGL